MAQQSNEEVVRRYWQAHAHRDLDTLSELRHPDWIVEWPQSRERIRGDANARAGLASYPGGAPQIKTDRFVGSEDRWVMTPFYAVQRIVGNGDFWWGDGTVSYPDLKLEYGEKWEDPAQFIDVPADLFAQIAPHGSETAGPRWATRFTNALVR